MPATFVRRERKHRRLAKQNAHRVTESQDANREVVISEPLNAKEARRKQLQAELIAQSAQGKVSSKKRKRLDHYIDTKLKREENAELIRRLAAQRVDTSLLQSSKTLGRVTESKRETLSRALRERDAGIDVAGDQHAILYQPKREMPDQSLTSSDEEVDDDENQSQNEEDHTAGPVSTIPPAFGSGLKRLHDGTDGEVSQIKRRKRRKKPIQSRAIVTYTEKPDNGELSDWDGFQSEDEGVKSAGDEQSPEDSNADGSDESINSNDDTDEYDSATSVGSEHASPQNSRSSAFKQWAEVERNRALDFQPSTAPVMDPSILATFRPRQASPDPLAHDLQIRSQSCSQRLLKAIVIERSTEVQSAREALPVVQEEQKIMEAIRSHPIVIVCGATGSGKTTQVPQMMLEGGYASHCGEKITDEQTHTKESRGMIGITQPRRVAAVAVAERVKTELGTKYGQRVAHHVRYDTTTSNKTSLKFMTDGILLRELHQDFILSRYSAIVIDEAHERSVNTDILIGTLSRIVALREELTTENPDKHYPLKLVIMSATLRVADFAQNQRLFRRLPPPIIEVEGRQFDVTVHFARTTQRDYESELVHKITRGHRKLPPGTILAFLTGQAEIVSVMKQLQQSIGAPSTAATSVRARITSDQLPLESEDMELLKIPHEETDQDPDLIGFDEDEERDDDFDIEEPTPETGIPRSSAMTVLKAQILPLYAALPADQQMHVFRPPPLGTRLIILATNVAETSLTIPGVKYVFDCGRSKEKKYDNESGITAFEVDWISKASALQRTGRAGRTGPGHCWRLYSSALYEEHFPEHSIPEILRTPIESIVLQLKAMEIDNVPNFPFPTPPDKEQLRSAEKLLGNLGALQANGKLSEHGRELMHYPLSPRFGKILLLAARNKVLDHAVALVAALAVGDIFLPSVLAQAGAGSAEQDQPSESQQSYGRAQALLSRWDDQSDAIKMLTAVAVHADATKKRPLDGGKTISHELYLREKSMSEVQQLRGQLRSLLRSQSLQAKSVGDSTDLVLATAQQRKMLNQIVAAAFLDQVAIRADLLPNAAAPAGPKPRRSIEVPYYPLFPVDKVQPASAVFVHPTSVLARSSKDQMPGYIVYSHLSRAAAKTITEDRSGDRIRMHPLTNASGKVLASLAQETSLLQVGKPIGKIEEQDGGKRRVCWVSIALRPRAETDNSTQGIEWPLSSWRVEQARQRNGEWEVVKILSR